jgi:hypothetical protein
MTRVYEHMVSGASLVELINVALRMKLGYRDPSSGASLCTFDDTSIHSP